MKYRYLVPAIYVLLVLLFFVFLVIGAGHGRSPFEFVFYLTYPAAFLLNQLPALTGPGGGMLLLLLFMLTGLIQWALLGYLIDKLIAWRRKKRLAQNVGQS